MEHSEPIHELLDNHVDLLSRLGSNVSQFLVGGSDPSTIVEQLAAVGLDARPDVVEYFSWRTPMREQANFFRYTMFLPTLKSAIEIQQLGVEAAWVESFPDQVVDDFVVARPFGPDQFVAPFRSPPFLLPVAYIDSNEYVAVDTRLGNDGGGIYFCSQFRDGAFTLFDSLSTMVAAATWLLETGQWVLYEDGPYFRMRNADEDW